MLDTNCCFSTSSKMASIARVSSNHMLNIFTSIHHLLQLCVFAFQHMQYAKFLNMINYLFSIMISNKMSFLNIMIISSRKHLGSKQFYREISEVSVKWMS